MQDQSKDKARFIDDWICSSCGNDNWARKTHCNRCGTEKSKSSSIPKNQIKKPESEGEMIILDEARAAQNQQHEDWVCASCKNSNWARRTQCNKCGIGRFQNSGQDPQKNKISNIEESKVAQEKAQEDWRCGSCNNTNWGRRTHCNKCCIEKSESLKQTAQNVKVSDTADKTPQGDWYCLGCGICNFGRRELCFKCNAKRPTEVEIAKRKEELERIAAQKAAEEFAKPINLMEPRIGKYLLDRLLEYKLQSKCEPKCVLLYQGKRYVISIDGSFACGPPITLATLEGAFREGFILKKDVCEKKDLNVSEANTTAIMNVPIKECPKITKLETTGTNIWNRDEEYVTRTSLKVFINKKLHEYSFVDIINKDLLF